MSDLTSLQELKNELLASLHEKPDEASVFIAGIVRREEAIQKNNEDSDPHYYLKLCGNNPEATRVRICDEDLPQLFKAMCNHQCITMLDLRYNRITNVGAEKIGAFLQHDKCLEELNLLGNDITDAGAKHIAKGLMHHPRLLILKMTGNPIGSRGAIHLAHALQLNTSLEYLDVGECDLGIDGCIAITTLLRTNCLLLGVNLSRPLLFTHQEEQTVHLQEMLQINKTLRALHLSKFAMKDFGAGRLADALHRNTSLQLLDLSLNRISTDGCFALSKALLLSQCSLVVLDLAYNRVQCAGAKALGWALLNGATKLRILHVAHNEIASPGLRALAEALGRNKTLRCLYVWGNDFDNQASLAFANLLDSGRLLSDYTDVRPYYVGDVCHMAQVDNDCEYRAWRFSVPSKPPGAPNDRSLALL